MVPLLNNSLELFNLVQAMLILSISDKGRFDWTWAIPTDKVLWDTLTIIFSMILINFGLFKFSYISMA